MLRDPTIHQGIARASVPTRDIAAHCDQADIGDAANVYHCSRGSFCDQPGSMEGGYQRGTLTACGHIPASKIGDHGNAREFGQPVGVTDL